ncbi:MAG: TonB-dependent receptor [Rhizomicrobium sp.]|nr:TonB-dependent receptor [Rhizomicrobium sp.]
MRLPERTGVNLARTLILCGAVAALSVRASASSELHNFDIPAQSAGLSFPEFARQAQLQIVAPGEKLRQVHTPALHGTLTVREALAVLLQGTGLTVASETSKLIILTASVADASADKRDIAGGYETVTVTGYHASLASTVGAKRAAFGFTDSIFAEDIGKFSDSSIAEAFNRIPGITISREIDGSGVNVAIRGLGPNFTKVLLNGTQVSIASTGPTNASNPNREVDLNMFPVELFSELTANKSPQADHLEGGTAGTINIRSLRPFDRTGPHVTYVVNLTDVDSQNAPSPSGTLIVSDTIGPFGALIGVTNLSTRFFTRGYETAGWTTPLLATDGAVVQCAPAASCNTLGGGNWVIPSIVPANVTTGGLVPGAKLDQAALLALNPGLSLTQLNNMLLPRLGRPFMEKGVRSRYNGVASLEYRPSDWLRAYIDVILARTSNSFDRSDINWEVRNGAAIPIGVTVDANNVVTSGTFANANWLLEARPYREYGDFYSINPGVDWQATDLFHLSWQANASRSHFFRDAPTILLATASSAGNATGVTGAIAPAGGVTVAYDNSTGSTPSLTTNVALNDPAAFQWAGGRVNISAEKRYTYTAGTHLDLQYGGSEANLKLGFAYDEAFRDVIGYDNSQAWQNAVCGDNPNIFLPNPNSQPSCDGLSVVGNAATVNAVTGYPTYPGLGSGYSTGSAALAYRGSLIPQTQLSSYLKAGPAGFVNVDYAKFFKDSHYDLFDYPNASVATNTALGVGSGNIDEKTYGLYLEFSGENALLEHRLHYNVGLRWVDTQQTVAGPVSHSDPRNLSLVDGAYYPNVVTFVTTKRNYQSLLPSANLMAELGSDFQLRASLSRTMTRPSPNSMLPGLNFSDPAAAIASIGNPQLKPYYSFNMDLGAEYYTGGEGNIAIALFRKSISGFTVSSTQTEPFAMLAQYGVSYGGLTPTQRSGIDARGGPAAATVQLTQTANRDSDVIVRGVELSVVQPWDRLPAPFDIAGLGVMANLTIVGQGDSTAVVTGVSPISYNLIGYYEKDGVSLRLSYVFNGRQVFTDTNQNGICLPNIASGTCPAGARVYNKAYAQLDLSAGLKLARLYGPVFSDPELTLTAKNLTKSNLQTYFQYSQAVYASYQPSRTYVIALRGSF